MVDVFVSGVREDADRLAPLISLLEGQGFSVWWGRSSEPDAVAEHRVGEIIGECSTVLVALTARTASSSGRLLEVAARVRDKVVLVLFDNVTAPPTLRDVPVIDLAHWSGTLNAETAQLLTMVAKRMRRKRPPFAGRAGTMHSLQQSLQQAFLEQGSVVLLSGEPGIGKTRCAEEFARVAEDHGALVLWGRCSEQQGAPAYWPWTQVLRDYAEASAEDELRVTLEGAAEAVAALAPEVAGRLGIAGLPRHPVDSSQHFRLLDSVARLLFQLSVNLPLVIVIEDLHWADASSLAMLEYIVGELRARRLLILATYRDVEVTRGSPIQSSLGELMRAKNASRVKLHGLDERDTELLSTQLSGMELPDDVAEAIYRQTDGNPLFIGEIARSIRRERRADSAVITVDVPEGVKEAFGRRLDRLPSLCNAALAAASVVGVEFDAVLLAHAMGYETAECMRRLGPAEAVGIVVREDDSSTSFRFAHALMREALYDELPTIDRLHWHQRIAEALAGIHSARPEAALSRLAHHYCEAAALGHFEVAIDYSIRAAEQAAAMFAFEDAARLYDEALRVMRAFSSEGNPRVAPIYFEQGKLWEALGRFDQAIACYSNAIGLAREQNRASLFAECAMSLVFISSDSAALHAAPLLEEVLRLLPGEAGERGIVTAHLAFALRGTDDHQRIARLTSEAIAFARQVDDRAALARTLLLSIMALRGFPASLGQRIEYGREMLKLSPACPKPQEELQCHYWHLLNLMEVCAMQEFGALFDRYDRLVTSRLTPHHQYYAMSIDIMLRLTRGEWSGLEERIEKAFEYSRRLERKGADGVYGAQMFMLNRELGRLPAMAPLIRRMVEDPRSRFWEPGLMLMCSEAGLEEEARVRLDELSADRFGSVPRDDLWVTCIVFCAEACADLEVGGQSAVLYDLLLPSAGQSANHPNCVCFGAVDGYLGALAALMGDRQRARGHFERALATNRSLGAWPALARTQVRFGRMLLDSDEPDESSEGLKLLENARSLAVRFTMKGLERRIDLATAARPGGLPDGLSPREVEVLKLIAIGRSNKDISKALSISLSTVATHVRNILGKTDCVNRTEAAAYALRMQIT